jgi:excisionase family DNA binding protein
MTINNAVSPFATTHTTTELLTTDQVADVLGLSSRTIAAWRSSRNNSLPYVKAGSRVRYRLQDVIAWLESRVRFTAAPAGGRVE